MVGDTATPRIYQNPLYTPADFYMVRTPVLPSNVFWRVMAPVPDMTGESSTFMAAAQARKQSYEAIHALLHEPVVQQALAIASTDILEAIARIQRGDATPRRLERAYASILRYLIRMSTRPTPFGLFAGVATGTLEDTTQVQLGTPVVQRIRTRPDMRWLLTLIQHIEEDDVLMPRLHVVTNRTVYFSGARAILPYADVYSQQDNRSITLRATSVVRFVLELAHLPISYGELRQKVLQAFPSATEQQAERLLHQLRSHHFLLSDLRPPFSNSDPTLYMLKQLENVPGTYHIVEALKEVLGHAARIDQIGAGGSTTLIRELIERQERLVAVKEDQPYQIDTALRVETPSLNRAIGYEAAQATETLLRLGRSPHGLQHIREYHMAFLERYGEDVEVPILDLLSPEDGLDAPSGYTEPRRTYPLRPLSPPNTQGYDRALCILLEEAISRQAMEIELTPALIAQLSQWTPGNIPPLPSTLEMYLQIHAASHEAIDRGEWLGVVAPACLAHGGRTFCRFFDILEPQSLQRLQAYAKQEETLLPDTIVAELSYLPTFGRGANVVARPALHAYEIVINTAPSVAEDKVIPLQDIVVGVRGARFYLRSLRLNKEVVVTQSHMLNPMRAPNICRFLLEVSQDAQPVLSIFDWGVLSDAPFLPRIVQQRIVLSPAQWNVRSSMLELESGSEDEERWFDALRKWRARWRVPRYVYLAQFDNRLLLDLEHPLALAELRAELKHVQENQAVQLQEVLPDFAHLWVQDGQQEAYFAEFVIPLLRTMEAQASAGQEKSSETSTEEVAKHSPRYVIRPNERRFLPGSEWVYLKLYTPYRQHDEIIAGPLRHFIHQLSKEGLIDRWFYLRYADPEPHLRLRLHAASPQSKDSVIMQTLAWGRELEQGGHIGRVCMDTYEREIERYGGPEAIDMMEMVFSANSSAVSLLVGMLYRQEITLEPLAVAVLSLDHFFSTWGLDTASRLKYIQRRISIHSEQKAFRPYRRQLQELLVPWDADYDAAIKEQRERICQMLSGQNQILKEAALCLHKLAASGQLWRNEDDILGSLAHMHINRLLGINHEQESQIYAFWRLTLESLQRRPAQKKQESSL